MPPWARIDCRLEGRKKWQDEVATKGGCRGELRAADTAGLAYKAAKALPG